MIEFVFINENFERIWKFEFDLNLNCIQNQITSKPNSSWNQWILIPVCLSICEWYTLLNKAGNALKIVGQPGSFVGHFGGLLAWWWYNCRGGSYEQSLQSHYSE